MSDPLYRKEILRLAADAHGHGHLSEVHRTGTAHNPTCGDKVTVDIAADAHGRITAVAQEAKACVLTQASASILGERLQGASQEAVEKLANEVAAMLANDGAVPEAPFDAFAAFQGAVTHRNRHRCVLLPIEAVLDAFDNEPNQQA